MKRKSKSTISKLLRHYRRLCDTHSDPFVRRMAQAMETSIRWATEDTRGWNMRNEPFEMSQCLKNDVFGRTKP